MLLLSYLLTISSSFFSLFDILLLLYFPTTVNLYGLKALFMSNLGLNYEYLNKVLIPSYPLYNIAYYDKRFPAIGVQN